MDPSGSGRHIEAAAPGAALPVTDGAAIMKINSSKAAEGSSSSSMAPRPSRVLDTSISGSSSTSNNITLASTSFKSSQARSSVSQRACKQSKRRTTSLSNSIRRLLTFVRSPTGSGPSADANNNHESNRLPRETERKAELAPSQQASKKLIVYQKGQSATMAGIVPSSNPNSGAGERSESSQSQRSSLKSQEGGFIECKICVLLIEEKSSPQLDNCNHRVCLECMQRYITTEINNSRLNITCPACSEQLHPNTIKRILRNEKLYLKYESFMLRRVLAAEPDARWCPAPDCGYVVLASGCASCPKLVCARQGCATSFCYHCKQEWHPDQTCKAASIKRNNRSSSDYYHADVIERDSSKSSQRVDDIKECPVCASRIVKMNDGSCNHITCSICEAEFCWLCMKEISDLHYFSPSGCTFWGKKPWSRKKKLLWQLGMLIGAPICIILIAGVAVPAIVVGIPVWAARKLKTRLEQKQFSRYRKNAIITGGVILSLVVSPFISAVALAIGIPFLLGYVYGVVPLSLCRSSGGCLSSKPSLENIQQSFQAERIVIAQARDGISIDTALSHKIGDPSIGETSLHMSDISLEIHDRESASNAALAGSILSSGVEDGSSIRVGLGSGVPKESVCTLIPAEVHKSNLSAV